MIGYHGDVVGYWISFKAVLVLLVTMVTVVVYWISFKAVLV